MIACELFGEFLERHYRSEAIEFDAWSWGPRAALACRAAANTMRSSITFGPGRDLISRHD